MAYILYSAFEFSLLYSFPPPFLFLLHGIVYANLQQVLLATGGSYCFFIVCDDCCTVLEGEGWNGMVAVGGGGGGGMQGGGMQSGACTGRWQWWGRWRKSVVVMLGVGGGMHACRSTKLHPKQIPPAKHPASHVQCIQSTSPMHFPYFPYPIFPVFYSHSLSSPIYVLCVPYLIVFFIHTTGKKQYC